MSDFDLSSLLASAMAQKEARKVEKQKPKPVVLVPSRPVDAPVTPATFDPCNWLPGKALAVIHRSSDIPPQFTVVGTFREFTHKYIKHARKLSRIETPTPIDGEEYVTGDIYLPRSEEPPPTGDFAPERMEDVHIIMPVSLECISVYAAGVRLTVRRERGIIRSARLTISTRFVCPITSVIVWLPKGTDLLASLTFDDKVQLKELTDRYAKTC